MNQYYIVQNLADTDWYKLLMLQFIWKHYRNTKVSWRVKNRTKSVKLKDCFSRVELEDQLNHVYTLHWSTDVLNFISQWGVFDREFIQFLRNEFKLSSYEVTVVDGDYQIDFYGDWVETTMWEIYALEIINELRNRHEYGQLNKFDQPARVMLEPRAKIRLDEKLTKLSQFQDDPKFGFADFGTRRRWSFEHQLWACQFARMKLPRNYRGTSNVLISMLMDTRPIGTNAHELPMVAAALCERNADLKWSQYEILDRWGDMYPDYKIMLPDTFGTRQFLKDAPLQFLDWDGIRVDSMNPFLAGGLIMSWYENHDEIRGPVKTQNKKIIFSDGLDVDEIISLYDVFKDIFQVSFGWGTLFTNDMRGFGPDPISLVCKVCEVEGRSAVKLSDNLNKAMGSPEEIERYKLAFDAYENQLQAQKVIV